MPAILSVLLIAAAAVLCWRMAKQLEAKRRKKAAGDEGCLEYRTALAFDECLDALAARTDYNASGVIIICALYLTRTNRKWQCLAGALLFMFELTAPLAFVLVWFYNGQRGACSPLQKKAFYWFYPVHLLVLAGITNLLL